MKKQIEGNIVDIHNRKIFPGTILIEDGTIVSIRENANEYDQYILPGFVDAHVHIESSMLTPKEFSKSVISKGTVAIVNDPHEIANVLGKEGICFMLENSRESLIKMFFTIPSCVPATAYDFSGSVLSAADVEDLVNSGRFIGLSEMMNVPGVLKQDPETIKKIELIRERHLPIDGHAPGLRGKDLNFYIQSGISTDHECVSLEEALEKINSGMKILIREGSAAKNYEALKSLIALCPEKVMFCTDDSHPDDIIHRGHIDKIVKRAVQDGFDLFDVLKIASLNPVKHYNLKVGVLREGDDADFIVVKDLNSFCVRSVYISGEEKFNFQYSGRLNREESLSSSFHINKFLRTPISVSDLQKSVETDQKCILVKDGEIITQKDVFSVSSPVINFESDVDRDILKIVYLNRYGQYVPQIAYIRGIGLKKGAFATSISHDSHNIIAVGCHDGDLAAAVNAVIAEKGGLSVVSGEEVAILPLPIAGIMSDKNAEEVAQRWKELIDKLHDMGCCLSSPFMTLSFMALIVIPELKIGEKGLFEFSRFQFIDE